MKKHSSFVAFYLADQPNGYLSNWYPAPFDLNGLHFENTEQYLMYRKALQFEDVEIAMQILQDGAPDRVKRLGRQVRGYVDAIWTGVRQVALLPGLLAKFSQNPQLRKQLLDTGDALLAECSPTDRVWGIGLSMDAPDCLVPERWRGANLLGALLMEVRAQLRRQIIPPSEPEKVWLWCFSDEQRRSPCWFETDDSQMVVCRDGSGDCVTLSEEDQQHMHALKRDGVLPANWVRARLFMQKWSIWDATAFACSIRAICYGHWTDFAGRRTLLLFASCPTAEQEIYPLLSERQIVLCQENIALFYRDPQAQREWQGVILHPVCLMIVEGQKEMLPISIAHLPANAVHMIRWRGPLHEPVEQVYRTPELFEDAREI